MLHLFKLKQNPANIFAIWFICNQENLGDTNMFKGINNAFEQTAKEQNLVINTLLINPGEATFYVANVQPPQIIFAIGDLGARAIKNIIDSSGDKLHTTKFVWAGHMVFESLLSIHHVLSVTSLPAHAISPELREMISKSKLLPTIGVAHNVSINSVRTAYELWGKNLFLPKIPNSAKYLGIFLGGDAPLTDGVTQLIFPPAQAIELAKYVNRLMADDPNITLLITNSPRTGRFNQNMSINPGAHANNSNISYEIPTDMVSKAFLDSLELSKARVFFCDFRYNAPSAYQPILALLQKSKDGRVLVTGDSTSMVSEICDLLPKQNIIIARIGSMNAFHHAHIDSMLAMGYLVVSNMQENEFVAERVVQIFDEEKQPSAASIIAKQLCNIIRPSTSRPSLNLSG